MPSTRRLGRARRTRGVPKPIATMRLYPTRFFPLSRDECYCEDETHLYVRALVFETKDEMYRYCEANGMSGDRNYEAKSCTLVARRYTKTKTRTLGEFCELIFWRGRLGTEIVSHELTHAALGYARRRGIAQTATADDTDPNWMQREEVVCYALGSMMRQFVNRAYALGLYDGNA